MDDASPRDRIVTLDIFFEIATLTILHDQIAVMTGILNINKLD